MTVVLESPAVDGKSAAAEPPAAESGMVGTVTAAALHTALSDALHFTARAADKVPALEAVRLEAEDGQLVAVATDRYTLGASRVDYSGAAFTVMVAAADAKALAAIAKTGKRDEKWREVTVEVAADGVQLTFRFNSGETMTVRGLDVSFPKWRALLPRTDSRMGATLGMGYQPALLAKFTKVRPAECGAAVVAFPSLTPDGRPGLTVIQVGEGFIGLLLPMRPAGNGWRYEPPAWLHEPASVPASGSQQVR